MRATGRRAALVGVVVLAVASAVVAVAVLSTGNNQPPTSAETSHSSPATPPSQEAARNPVAQRPTVAEAVALLGDRAREWNMTVLGDSTGDDADEFPFIVARRMNTAYSRPVIVHR